MKRPLEEVLKGATPAPWVAVSDEFSTRVTSDLCLVADCSSHAGPLQGEVEANAALLAHFRNIGPELVEALRRLMLEVESITAHGAGSARDELIERLHMDDSSVLRQARHLLSRAKEVEL